MKQPASPYVIQIKLSENTTFNETVSHANQIIDAAMTIAPNAKITIQKNSIGSALADAARLEHPEVKISYLLATLNENIEKMYAANRATPVMLSLPETDQPTHPEKLKESLYFETSLDAAKWLVERLHEATEQYDQHRKDSGREIKESDFHAYDALWLTFLSLNDPERAMNRLRHYLPK